MNVLNLLSFLCFDKWFGVCFLFCHSCKTPDVPCDEKVKVQDEKEKVQDEKEKVQDQKVNVQDQKVNVQNQKEKVRVS